MMLGAIERALGGGGVQAQQAALLQRLCGKRVEGAQAGAEGSSEKDGSSTAVTVVDNPLGKGLGQGGQGGLGQQQGGQHAEAEEQQRGRARKVLVRNRWWLAAMLAVHPQLLPFRRRLAADAVSGAPD